jgi:hypothetical protein
VAAYIGGLPFALFWGIAAVVVLWEWMTLVVGPKYRVLVVSCAAAIAVADFLAWLGRPVTALFMVGLGALAGAIFAPGERRLWVLAGTVTQAAWCWLRYFCGRTPASDLR